MRSQPGTQPVGPRILVRPFPADEISEGGIIVPDSVKQRPNKATVVATGGGIKERPMRYKAGDVVFHVKDAGTEIIEDGVKYYLMMDTDVLCTLV
jgi:chaperonin GroES